MRRCGKKLQNGKTYLKARFTIYYWVDQIKTDERGAKYSALGEMTHAYNILGGDTTGQV
jgi:hypothetical protein